MFAFAFITIPLSSIKRRSKIQMAYKLNYFKHTCEMDFQLMRHLALLTILFRSLFWNSFFPWLFHLFTLTGVRVFKNLQFDEEGDKEGVWRSVWFSRNFLNLDQIRFKLSLRHLSLASIFVQAWSYLDIWFSRFPQRKWVSFSNRGYIFRGALPPYFLQSLWKTTNCVIGSWTNHYWCTFNICLPYYYRNNFNIQSFERERERQA